MSVLVVKRHNKAFFERIFCFRRPNSALERVLTCLRLPAEDAKLMPESRVGVTEWFLYVGTLWTLVGIFNSVLSYNALAGLTDYIQPWLLGCLLSSSFAAVISPIAAATSVFILGWLLPCRPPYNPDGKMHLGYLLNGLFSGAVSTGTVILLALAQLSKPAAVMAGTVAYILPPVIKGGYELFKYQKNREAANLRELNGDPDAHQSPQSFGYDS